MSNYIDLAKKLKALADRGIGGEKVNAERMLNDLLEKHSITIEQLEEEEKQDFFFNLKKEIADYEIWTQIVGIVNHKIRRYGEFPKELIEEQSLPGNYMINCTRSEYIELEAKFDFYKRLFKEEYEIFLSAFFKANDLLVKVTSDMQEHQIKNVDLENRARISAMAEKIKVGEFLKQLPAEIKNLC